MKILKIHEINKISGGVSDFCLNAYFKVHDNRSSLSDLFIFIFLTPLAFIGKVMGEESAVRSICGSSKEYEEAKALYCISHPEHCKPKT